MFQEALFYQERKLSSVSRHVVVFLVEPAHSKSNAQLSVIAKNSSVPWILYLYPRRHILHQSDYNITQYTDTFIRHNTSYFFILLLFIVFCSWYIYAIICFIWFCYYATQTLISVPANFFFSQICQLVYNSCFMIKIHAEDPNLLNTIKKVTLNSNIYILELIFTVNVERID